jgi:uncharacterized protein (DUF1778 family)
MARGLAFIEAPKDRDRLLVAKEQLIARLNAEVRPDRRKLLSRAELAKVVGAAVQAYLVRHGLDANPLDRRELVASIIEALLNPSQTEPPSDGSGSRRSGRAVIATAEMPIADMLGLESVPVRKERFEARISSEQKALFRRAAELQGRTLTDFVIASAHDAAVRTIEEMEIIRLSAADSRAFAEALLNPRQPPAELRTAAERYRKMVGQ